MRGLEEIVRELGAEGELVHLERIPAAEARFAVAPSGLDPRIANLVNMADSPDSADVARGLWGHQAAAIEAVLNGESVVIATGTASGKSRCYQLPIAHHAVTSKGTATSLLLFPTKALAQDQLRSLGELANITGHINPVTYDGDTDQDARQWSRRHANAVLTNPDMLHSGILPFHGRWANFFKRLKIVVIDELHIYRGIFGTHLAQILRRLQRICAEYGSDPVFVFASATIGSPGELASELCTKRVRTIDDDCSPRGERLVAVWRPPSGSSGVPVSPTLASSLLLAGLVAEGRRTIAFTRARRSAELVAARAQRIVGDDLASLIEPYRGGYLASERRAIESKLFDGSLRGVATTNALELGMDIGGLDACICTGFPGTIASFRQQIGRAGRSAQESLAILVAGDDALDQWYADHPLELFRRPPERVVVNTANPYVLTPHVACAAFEIPLTADDGEYWAEGTSTDDRLGTVQVEEAFEDSVRELVLSDQLLMVNGRAVWAGRASPASRVSLRSSSGLGEFRIVNADAKLIGTVDGTRALASVHEGAIYLHQGQQYRVLRFDLEDHAAWVQPVNVDEYTQAKTDTQISFVHLRHSTEVGPWQLHVGNVEVTEQVIGYQRKKASSGAVISTEELLLPPSTLQTTAFWYEVDDDSIESAGLLDDPMMLPGTLHAIEHCAIGMLPLFAICDRWDVGGVSTASHHQNGAPIIAIYDGYPGGAGVAELGYAAGERHLSATFEALLGCPCEHGCPSCVQSPKCGNGNEPLSKLGAIALLRAVV
jgi:DEAD/DEAH box helicase domain-containing protein